mgnify:FL=1|tara:strand:- start:135 stop:887 length:753 start_codon:yes stop_codon:yes gene_type:complete
MSEFKNKIVLVTGGTSGIGQVTAELFAKEGAIVIIAGRRKSLGEKLAKKINGFFVSCDVSVEEDVISLMNFIKKQFGQLNIAFNNAGIVSERSLIVDCPSEKMHSVIDINLKGVWFCMKYEIPLMPNGSAIVNMSSVAGITAGAQHASYIASKHGVIGLTKAASVEYGKTIRVNAVCPAVIKTDMTIKQYETPEKEAETASRYPIGRLGESKEIADAVLWLSSNKASFINGHSVVLDGGKTIYNQGTKSL